MRHFSFKLATKQSRILCLLFLLLVGGWSQSFAQRSNSVYAELGGAAGHYSLNYERLLAHNDKLRFYGSIGFSPTLLTDNLFSPRIPIQFKFGFPVTRGLEIEVGGGLTPYWAISTSSGYSAWAGSYSHKSSKFVTVWTGRIGVRHQFGSRSYLGCYYTPFFEEQYEGQPITHWAAVTVGFKF